MHCELMAPLISSQSASQVTIAFIGQAMEEIDSSRFYFASHSAMLFALFLDNYEIANLTESLNEITQSIVGGRTTIRFGPEIALTSRAIYYTCSLLCFGRTPGQSFCDFTLVKSSLSANGQQEVAKKVQRDDLLAISALYSVLPYLYQRKDVICKAISDVCQIVVAPESLGDPNIVPETQPADTVSAATDSTTTNADHTCVNTTRESSTTSSDSFLAKFLRAVRSSVASMAATSADRMEIIVSFLADVHRFLFLYYGRFLEIPLRLVQLRLVTKTNPRAQAALKSLSWLVGFRITLLVYYATRVLLAEVDRELNTTTATTSATTAAGASSTDNNSGFATTDTPAVDSADVSHTASCAQGSTRCSLCIDTLTEPAVVPCGHIFCWECILRYTRSNSGSTQSSVGVGAIMKCPICRTEFPSQKIRALYNYS